MPTYAEQLISRMLRKGCIGEVLEWGITREDFKTVRDLTGFDFLYGAYQTPEYRNSRPGMNMIQQWPGYEDYQTCDDPGVATEMLCALTRKDRIEIDARKCIEIFSQKLDINYNEAISDLQKRLSRLLELGNSKITDVTYADALMRIELSLNDTEKAPPKRTWPWEVLNQETNGIQDDDYIVLYGRPKSKKSWVLAYLVGHMYQKGLRVLLYTKEMTPDNLLRRVAACINRIQYQDFRSGNLGSVVEKQMREYIEAEKAKLREGTDEYTRMVCLAGQDVPNGMDTVQWLKAKVEKYKPDIVFIDGLYLMSPGKMKGQMYERVTSISREARQMVLATQIPVIATAQANRKAAGHNKAELDELAYADAIGQDATAAFRVISEKADDNIILATAGSREFKMEGIRIRGVPAVDFTFIEQVTEAELNRAKESDAEPEEGSAKKPMKSFGGKRKGISEKARMEAQLEKMPSMVPVDISDKVAEFASMASTRAS